jgi:hypothetical protein
MRGTTANSGSGAVGYSALVLSCRCRIQYRISQASKQRTTAQIAAPLRRFTRIAAASAEVPNAKAIKNPKAAPAGARSLRSCRPLSSSTPDASNCPLTDFQLTPRPARCALIGTSSPRTYPWNPRKSAAKRISGMVPSKGLEPPHRCRYMDLNHARLPIPPRWQVD